MKVHAGLLIGCLLLPPPVPAAVAGGGAVAIDARASQVGFAMRTRWGQRLDGAFPLDRGDVVRLPDGTQRVRVVLDAPAVEIVDHPRYTRYTRGEGFLDVERWPEVEMQSDPFLPQLLLQGGQLAGTVAIRGTRRTEVFAILPATCDRPLFDCPVVAEGEISRSDYGMERWGLVLGDRVVLHLSLWAREPGMP